MANSRAISAQPNDWRKVFAVAVWSALIGGAAVVLSRRVAGAFAPPESVVVACATASLAALFGLIAYGVLCSAQYIRPVGPIRFTPLALTLSSPLLFAGALLPALDAFGLCFVIALLVVCAGAAQFVDDIVGIPSPAFLATNGSDVADELEKAASLDDIDTQFLSASNDEPGSIQDDASPEGKVLLSGDDSIADTTHSADVVQWMSRRKLAGGTEHIEGAVQVPFLPGQKQAALHVPFIPPLGESPQVECHLVDDRSARLRVSAVQPYGARIEVKLPQTSECSESIEVRFVATATSRQSDAA